MMRFANATLRSELQGFLKGRQSATYAVVNASHLRECTEQVFFQAVGGIATQNLRRELLGCVAGVFGGGEPAGVSADDEAEDMFDGTAKFGGVVEDGSVFFIEHSGGGASP